MSLLDPVWTSLLYLAAAVFFILALRGLNSPRTARRGNLIGAFGALVAVVTVFLSSRLDNIPWILAAIAVGSAVAAPVARRVKMTQMPQLVALFNGWAAAPRPWWRCWNWRTRTIPGCGWPLCSPS